MLVRMWPSWFEAACRELGEPVRTLDQGTGVKWHRAFWWSHGDRYSYVHVLREREQYHISVQHGSTSADLVCDGWPGDEHIVMLLKLVGINV